VAGNIARILHADPRFELLPWSLTGPGIDLPDYKIDNLPVRLILPEVRDAAISEIMKAESPFISVDFTLPAAANANAEFYCRNQLPFVMGTTGGDRERLAQTVLDSSVCAVIAPNMAKQIVGFQAMMEYAAQTFPGLFEGFSLEIKESHQSGKADTSGTAKAMVTYFNKLGVPFTETDIVKIRDPEIQKTRMGIPEAYISGHAWHTYTLDSPDKTARFEFTHNINGRDIYAWGTADAILYLEKKIRAGAKGAVFSMIDVLKGEPT
jgi:4-hydroxy-tetrahydrodipicolinate reductase